jgi:transcriptional regulator with XRE-family HTH domain
MARSGFGNRFPAHNSAVFKALAANIRRLRKERGWTQDDLAAAAKVEQAAISLMENARANPTLLMLETVAGALEVGFVDLFVPATKTRRSKEG